MFEPPAEIVSPAFATVTEIAPPLSVNVTSAVSVNPLSEIWIPWSVPQQWEHDRNYHVNFVVARLKKGVLFGGEEPDVAHFL